MQINKTQIQWTVKSFDELSTDELYQIFKLRQEVFIEEQKCTTDIDELDRHAYHLMGMQEEQLIAYARMYAHNNHQKYSSFGRVAIAKQARGHGIAHDMMREILTFLETKYPTIPCIVSAQRYLQAFYEQYDFVGKGETYLEEGISHIKMIRASKSP